MKLIFEYEEQTTGHVPDIDDKEERRRRSGRYNN